MKKFKVLLDEETIAKRVREAGSASASSVRNALRGPR